jgi:RNA polymerase sigma-70 factor (ECF subfamily)
MGPDRFERLYLEHRDRVFAFLVYRTGDRELAEDLLGDVFERALRSWKRFDPGRGSEVTWLYAIALNRLRDHRRRGVVERRALERLAALPLPPVDAPESRLAERDVVMRSLEVLNPADRELIALRYGADLTAPQIADATGLPRTTVEQRLSRALRRLRPILDPESGEGGSTAPPLEVRANGARSRLAGG